MRYSGQIAAVLVIGITFLFGLLLVRCGNIGQAKIIEQAGVNEARLKLGRYLFYDRRLSANSTRACATCHNPEFAFTDGYKRSIGAFADLHQRNSSPLFNLQYYKFLTAADSSLHSVTRQMDQPLFNNHPVEMGAASHENEILARVKSDQQYNTLFKKAFPLLVDAVAWDNIKTAISQFVLSIQSSNSSYDRYIGGDSNAISPVQKRGMQLFFSAKFKCANCHGGRNFSTPAVTDSKGDTVYFFNVGLYNTDGKGAYPDYDNGLYSHTKMVQDIGKYRVPTLRNLVFTGPYFHDGSAASIAEAVNVFLEGGRNIPTGIYKGDGTKNRYKDSMIMKMHATANERAALINFLYSLSDSSFLQNKVFQNPFAGDETKKK